ncbi:hypothetical protein CKAH01_02401 [Colletotrichum kahawae]|uniref:Uncharacterized protein n=1 Tax=Colletotrichum kahawae TaxID=34407 RepID=A0AAD9Y1P9_COLKA|nr:hypothetical protein CKAH01_02401 [Colletotrichum kahawae]
MMGRLAVRDTQPQQVTSVKGPGSCASISSTTPSSVIPVGKKSPVSLEDWMEEEEPRGGAPVSCVRRGRRAHHNISRPLSIAIPPVVCCRYATAMRGQGCRKRVTAGRMRERWIDKRAWDSWEATEDLGRGDHRWSMSSAIWANALPPRNAMAGSQRQRAQTRQAATDESSRRMSIRATFASSSHAAHFKVEIGAWIHACRARGTGVGARDLHCDALRAVRGAAQQEEPRVLTVPFPATY